MDETQTLNELHGFHSIFWMKKKKEKKRKDRKSYCVFLILHRNCIISNQMFQNFHSTADYSLLLASVFHNAEWGITRTYLNIQRPYSLALHIWGCFRVTDYSKRTPKKFYVSPWPSIQEQGLPDITLDWEYQAVKFSMPRLWLKSVNTF